LIKYLIEGKKDSKMKKVEIAPSILSADFFNLEKEVKDLKKYGCNYLHFDVMDGHFVPNISFGAHVLNSIKDKTDLILDVHLMISDPKKYILDFVKAGAKIITFHIEAYKNKKDIVDTIKLIKENNCKCGLSIKINTDLNELKPYLNMIDLVLVMSVEPGFGGQSFNSLSINHLKEIKKLKEDNKYNYLIEIDGGINEETAKIASKYGAEILVAGSYIFNAKDKKEAIKSLIE